MTLEARVSGPARAIELADQSHLDLTDPIQIELLQQVVDLSNEAKRSTAALARVDRALAHSPKSPRLFELRGIVLAALARDGDARAAFERALELDSASARADAGSRRSARRRATARTRSSCSIAPIRSSRAKPTTVIRRSARTRIRRQRCRGKAAARDRPPSSRRRGSAQRSRLAAGRTRPGARLRAPAGGGSKAARRLTHRPRHARLGPLQRGEYADAVTALEAAVAREGARRRSATGSAARCSRRETRKRAREMLQAAVAAGDFPEAEDARRQLAQLTGG